jgi:hypothetical protein
MRRNDACRWSDRVYWLSATQVDTLSAAEAAYSDEASCVGAVERQGRDGGDARLGETPQRRQGPIVLNLSPCGQRMNERCAGGGDADVQAFDK